MASFGGLILTNKGRALQAKVQAGAPLHFTRIGVGDGNLGSSTIATLNALIGEKKSLSINKLKPQAGGKTIVGGMLSNWEVAVGFFFREIGYFAQDPDAGEILYCYANAGAGAEYIAPGGGADAIEKQIDTVILTANAANVTAEIASGIYALAADVGDMSTVPTSAKTAAGAISELYEMIEGLDVSIPDGSITPSKLSFDPATQAELDAHLADYIRQPGYAVTAGTANAYTVITAPAPTSYVDGMGIAVRIHAANTGASTINWNGLGAKSIVDLKGNTLTAGKLPTGARVSLRYSSAAGNFQLQGEGGEYGTAGAADVRASKTVGTEAGVVNGSLREYIKGSNGVITDLPNWVDVYDGAVDMRVTQEGFIPEGSYLRALLPTLTPSNIRQGVVVGTGTGAKIAGTMAPKNQASGTYGNVQSGTGDSATTPVRVTGLSFTPGVVIMYREGLPHVFALYIPSLSISVYIAMSSNNLKVTSGHSVFAGGFELAYNTNGGYVNVKWLAIE